MRVAEIPVAMNALLLHKVGSCTGEWQLGQVPHPTDLEVARVVLSCDGCAAGHVYDVLKLVDGRLRDDGELDVGLPSQPRPVRRLQVVRP